MVRHRGNLSPPTGMSSEEASSEQGQLRFSRRDFLRLAGSVVAVATVAGCTPPPATVLVRSGGKVQLAFQDCRCLGEQLLLQDFHEAHPNIEVFYTPEPDNYEDRMLADMQAGVAPDVFAGCCDTFPVWAQEGYLLDLRPFVDSDLRARNDRRLGQGAVPQLLHK